MIQMDGRGEISIPNAADKKEGRKVVDVAKDSIR